MRQPHPLVCFAIALFAVFCGAANGGNYPFTVSAEKDAQGHQLVAHNRGPASVSLRVQPQETSNVGSDREWPVEAVIPPYTEQILARLSSIERTQKSRFALRVQFRTGSLHALHDSAAVYRLPFPEGRTFVISQAAGGPMTTHHSPDSQYAVDFTMPENTPILAARDGIVIETEDSYSQGGRDSALLGQANRVRVQHADQSIATYSHLAFRGVRVQVGERITAGTLLGLSGSTGYSSGPHLHFVVNELVKTETGFGYLSVPIRFYVGEPPHVFTPEYLQAITADYGKPGQPPPLAKTKRAERPVE